MASETQTTVAIKQQNTHDNTIILVIYPPGSLNYSDANILETKICSNIVEAREYLDKTNYRNYHAFTAEEYKKRHIRFELVFITKQSSTNRKGIKI